MHIVVTWHVGIRERQETKGVSDDIIEAKLLAACGPPTREASHIRQQVRSSKSEVMARSGGRARLVMITVEALFRIVAVGLSLPSCFNQMQLWVMALTASSLIHRKMNAH